MAAYNPIASADTMDQNEDGSLETPLDEEDLTDITLIFQEDEVDAREFPPDGLARNRDINQLTTIRSSLYKVYGRTNLDFKKSIQEALPRFLRPSSLYLTKEPGPTAYLDALRGYAAWNVFLAHGYKDYNFGWRNQPFISAIMAGEAMVALFFVISGYVLSYRLLILVRNQSSTRMLSSVAGGVFRRGIRLYGSTTFALFVALVMVRLRWYNPYDEKGEGIYLESIWEQLSDWCWSLLIFMDPFVDIRGYYRKDGLQNKYLGPMWTIPVEFRGSIILFGYITATCKLRVRIRLVLSCCIIICCYIWDALYVAEFLMGMCIAEITLIRYPERISSLQELPSCLPRQNTQSLVSKCSWTIIFSMGIFLLGQPNGNDLGILGDWPWAFLRQYIPSYYGFSDGLYWYLGVGASLVVLGFEMYPALQVPLKCGWSQYVGELSFGIYALHVPLLIAVIANWYEPDVRVRNGWSSNWGVLPGAIIMHLIVFTCSDYFNRVDKRVVVLGRWLQDLSFSRWT